MATAPQMARALFQFAATQAGDLSFEEDEIITVLKKNNNGWWEGAVGQRRGEFPFNYVEILTTRELQELMTKKIQEAQGNTVSKGDQVSDIQVIALPKSTNLKVTLALASGSRVEGTKNVAGFRTLDNKLREIYHDFDSSLPPMWADNAYFSEESNGRRAAALTSYLKKLVANPVKQYAMVNWLNPKAKFNAAADVKKQVTSAVKGVAASNRNSFKTAVEGAPALARVEFNWTPHDAVELQLIKKEIIAVLSTQTLSPGWWEGQNIDGQRGLFPYNHVKLLNAEEATALVLGETSTKVKAVGPGKQIKSVPKQAQVTPSRARKTHKMFALGSMDSFDALLVDGFTMEKEGRLVSDNVTNAPGPGDRCVMSYIGYVWDCQSQSIIEFASSDLPDKDGNIRKLEFTMNRDEVIKGIELAAGFMEKGQSVRLIVKPELAYGDVGFPQLNIPPSVHLVYDITLDEFSNAAVPGPPVANTSNVYVNAEAPKTLAEAIARQQQQVESFPNFNAPIQNRPGRGHGNQIKGYKAGGGGQQAQKPPAPSQAKKGGGGKPKKQGKAGGQYDLNKMREIVREKRYAEYGVQAAFLEENLTDQAFKEAFRCDRSAFILMPRWKQMKMKKDARLF